MEILKRINESRRSIMHAITKSIGGSEPRNHSFIDPSEIKRILITRPNNRLGNLLMVTPLMQELVETFPYCSIDLFVKGNTAPVIFKSYNNINTIIELPGKPFRNLLKYLGKWMAIKKHRYDLVINIDPNSSSGRLSTWFATSKHKVFGKQFQGSSMLNRSQKHMAKNPVYNFRNWFYAQSKDDKPIPSLNLKLGPFELSKGQAALQRVVGNNKKTIALFTYATGDKRFPEAWWNDFYERLLAEYDDYNIIEILPVQNVSQIGFKAPTFYSMNIRQMASLIAHTEMFISADSGIMHLATASQVPTVGLFSVTDPEKYGPYGNNSLSINTRETSNEECITILNSILFKRMAYAN